MNISLQNARYVIDDDISINAGTRKPLDYS